MPHAARPTVTLHDVAAAAGVSVATASRVLGGSSRKVAPEYEARVLAAAAALRYTVDASARAMRRAGDSIALVADDLTTPSMGMVVAAMEREARTAGAFVTVSSTMAASERQAETVRVLRSLRPRALVLTSSRYLGDERLARELAAYEREGGRVVIVGHTDLTYDSINLDNHGAGWSMGAYVAGLGHRRVVVLTGGPEMRNMADRTAGFVEGLRAGGVAERAIRIVACPVNRQGGFEAARRLAADGVAGGTAGGQAVLATNDTLAIGALAGLRESGLRVPDDVSVTGIDDIPLACDVTPRLTTVALPLAEWGVAAIRFALKESAEPRRLVLEGRLIVRDSTRARP
ncbi:LacI family DNA-binding transcriptional regulator [Nonomuraea gerenzanensis]|uniref:Regulatory protein, LacI n=1 Tax=Nonomuraea gerenzanensis TaxID=93944 RepID=A0A1M4E4W0_9ACTN|nr:LacI family DNA-binding transcriptional regulator [Nonomuraea gerenzanensis]UBU16012.1 LacI family transcriptional regulator [Nonomuraea gerenzanensis]SBO93814.1 regulatory protein, LacI [Nonomuraea gerenzanensis]